MFEMITSHYVEVVAILLFGIGLSLLIFHVNLIKKIMGLNIMDTGVYLFLASMGYINGGNAPIYGGEEVIDASNYVNPIPAGLVLTGIVVSVSVTAISLALTIRLYNEYHTLNLDEIYIKLKEKDAKEDE
ncbi:MAG: sodium:proton antiporter [Bacilli bacterium]|nr:cation:proton antiporter subunit C [Bacillales bacterium]